MTMLIVSMDKSVYCVNTRGGGDPDQGLVHVEGRAQCLPGADGETGRRRNSYFSPQISWISTGNQRDRDDATSLSLFYLYSFPSPPQPSFSVSVLRVSIDPPLRYDSHHRSLERSRRRTYTYAFRGSFFARCIRLPSGFNVSKFHPLSGVNDLWSRERKRFWRMIAISLLDFEKE